MIIYQHLTCTHKGILQDVPLQIWDGISSMGASNLPKIAVRALHNKPRYYAANYLQCYTNYYSPRFFVRQIGIVPSLLTILLLWLLWDKFPKIRLIIVIFLILFPIYFLFELHPL